MINFLKYENKENKTGNCSERAKLYKDGAVAGKTWQKQINLNIQFQRLCVPTSGNTPTEVDGLSQMNRYLDNTQNRTG